jgi:asparagine synthetase B (glutamine-hydrolysing)
MCGIAGYRLAKTDHRSAVALVLLTQAIEERGRQSWGLFTERPADTVKAVGPVTNGFMLQVRQPKSVAVHTRFATNGAVTQENAHPFVVGDITGMHNGMIYNHEELLSRYHRKCPVDSQHIFEHIAANLPLEDLEGYGAIVYRKGEDWILGTFNGGELTVCVTELGLFYASRKSYLQYALSVAGIDIKAYYKLEDGKLYTITPTSVVEHGAIPVSSGRVSWKWDDALRGTSTKTLTSTTELADWPDEQFQLAQDVNDAGLVECEMCFNMIAGKERVYSVSGDNAMLCDDCYFDYNDEGIVDDDIRNISY